MGDGTDPQRLTAIADETSALQNTTARCSACVSRAMEPTRSSDLRWPICVNLRYLRAICDVAMESV